MDGSATSAPDISFTTSIDDVTSSLPASNYEHLGFLKEMGLDYGWGTTAMMETILEHVHIYAGTPWWASIGITLLLVRGSLIKIYINAADATARNQTISELNQPLVDKMKAAQAKGDMVGMTQASKEMKDLRAAAGVKFWKMLMPFVSIPIGFGTFRLVRGMSFLPVPGLESGGLLWMQDLTLSDPYFVLPVLTAVAYFYAFKVRKIHTTIDPEHY